MFLARLLSVEDFGRLSYALTAVNLIGITALLGLPNALSRYVAFFEGAGEQGRAQGVWRRSLIDAMALALGIGALASGVSLMWPDAVYRMQGVGVVAAALCLMLPLRTYVAMSAALCAGHGRMKESAQLQSFNQPTLRLLAVGALMALSIKGLWSWLAALAVTHMAECGLAWWMLKRKFPAQSALSGAEPFGRRELYGFSLPIFVTTLMIMALQSFDVLVLGWYGQAHDVASYRVYRLMVMVGVGALASVGMSFVPVFTGMLARKEGAGLAAMYTRVEKWFLIMGTVGFLGLAAFGPMVVAVAFGQGYVPDGARLQLLIALAVLASGLFGPSGITLEAMGHVRAVLYISIITLCVMVVAGVWMTSQWGASGAAASAALAILTHRLLSAATLAQIGGIAPYEGQGLWMSIASIAAAIIGGMATLEGMWPVAAGLCIVYPITLLLSGVFDDEDRALLYGLLRKMGLKR